MPSMREIKARLRELGLENEFGYRAESRRIPECLEQDETLRAITSGLREGRRWYVLLTENRILYLAKPTLADPRLVAINRSEVLNVEEKRGLFFGSLTIRTAQDTYTFTNVLKKSLPSFLAEINHA